MQGNAKMLIAALVAAVLAFAVYYGLIDQQSATKIQTQANQTLGTTPATQQSAAPAPQPAPAPTAPAPTAPSAPATPAPAAPTSAAAPSPAPATPPAPAP